MILIKRKCSVCGEILIIKLNKDKTYSGGNYFGDILDNEEYWECNKCFNED